LRKLGIHTPILIMGGSLPEQVPLFIKNDLILAASTPELLETADYLAHQAKTKLKVHLKIDTGMERIGVHDYESESFIQKSLACSHWKSKAFSPIFANSEVPDLRHARCSWNDLKRSYFLR